MREPLFSIGQLIRHKRHNYRGVVYEVDPYGDREDQWSKADRTMEEKEEPWYRILVHDGQHGCFLPEHELEEDTSDQQILNPKLQRYFESFSDGRYKARIF
jgi:heat shock protein HspQ